MDVVEITGAQILQMFRRGALAGKINESVAEVIAAIQKGGGGKGSVTIKLNFTSMRVEGVDVRDIEMIPEVKSTLPALRLGKATYYPIGEGQLSRIDPGQAEFDFEKGDKS